MNSNNGWISIKEAIPKINDGEKYENFLVCLDDGFITSATYAKNEGWELWADSGEVTHWMPLPNPPSKHNNNLLTEYIVDLIKKRNFEIDYKNREFILWIKSEELEKLYQLMPEYLIKEHYDLILRPGTIGIDIYRICQFYKINF